MSISRKLQILIVDDNKMNQMAIRAQVAKIIPVPVDFSFADDGKRSVNICNEKSFDLIFMDYNMPEMNGEEATKNIRNQSLNPFDKCIILTCSATTSGENGYEGIYPGANDRLEKPIKINELRSILKKFNLHQENTPSEENSREIVAETRLRKHTTNILNDRLFSQATQSLDQDQNNDTEEEINCCRKQCTIV